MEKQKYVSIFKIDGIPILPPLMTAARRKEMLTYKERAVALEARLKLQDNLRQSTRSEELESISTVDDEYLKVSSMLQDPRATGSPCCTETQVTEDLITSIRDESNTRTILGEIDMRALESLLCSKYGEHSEESNRPSDLPKRSPCIIETRAHAKAATHPVAKKLPIANTKAKITAPENNLNNAANIILIAEKLLRKDIDSLKTTQRASTSPALRLSISPTPQLIRSSSFTLDSPSPALLEHLVRVAGNASHDVCTAQEAMSALSLKNSVTEIRHKTQNTKSKNTSFNSSKVGATQHANSTLFKTKKSPYDVKVCSKPKQLKKYKTPQTKRISSATLKSKNNLTHSKLMLGESPRRKVEDEAKSPKRVQPSSDRWSSPVKLEMFDHPPVGPATDRSSSVRNSPHTQTPKKCTIRQATNAPCQSPPITTSPPKDSPHTQTPKQIPIRQATNALCQFSPITTFPPKDSPHTQTPKQIPIHQATIAPCRSPITTPPSKDSPSTQTPKQIPIRQATNPPHQSHITTPPPKDFVEDKIKEIEGHHRVRIMELINKQQEEQRHLQEQFERQQKLLLEEFNTDLMSLKALQVSPAKRELDSPSEYPNDTNNNLNGFSSIDDQPTSLEDSQCYDMTSRSKQTPRCNRRLFMESSPNSATTLARRRDMAGTIITAYVRGYLTRRLFQTDHVQNIIQTIRDTLIFAIKYHRETLHDKSEENIRFKSRLLQQLTSGCESLQSVFNLPSKERMRLIASDRIYQEKKAKAHIEKRTKTSQNR